MYRIGKRTMWPAMVLAAAVIANSAFVFGGPVAGDLDEAIKIGMQIRQKIDEYKKDEVERLALQSIEYARKALSDEKKSENQDAIKAAIGYLNQVIKEARSEEYRQAMQSWSEAMKMYERVK
jgi:uncharacterized 2Fe-2S/4Fe-4S cluster protein (DUF4445 family)